MNWISLATLIAFASYLFYTGVLPSISDSYRKVDIRFYHLFFGVVSVMVWMQSIYTDDALDLWYGIAGFFLFCISIAAEFWKPGQKFMHVLFTYIAIALGQTLTVIRLWPDWGFISLAPVVVLIVGTLWLDKVKNSTFWREILAIATIFLPIL